MYDLIIVGAGPGGYSAALYGGKLGARVLLIEKEAVGGTCLNHGCIPTKALLKGAKLYSDVKHASSYGVNVSGDVSFDLGKAVSRKDEVVTKLTRGISYLLKQSNVEVVSGYGEVINKTTVKVGEDTYTGKKLILATGGTPLVPNIAGVKEAYISGTLVTSRELLNVKCIPNNFVVIGGGVVGVEFATAFALLGSNVTLIEKEPHILPLLDHSIRRTLYRELTKLKINVITNAEVTKVSSTHVYYKAQETINEVASDLTLMAVGTKASTEAFSALNLKQTGNYVATSEYLETSVEGVYALGDVNGRVMLAHTASAEALVAVNHALGKATNPLVYQNIPQAIFTSPEIASVGLTEEVAKEQGLNYKTSQMLISANGKAQADGDERGFIKLVACKDTDLLLGAHILSSSASELIGEFVIALNGGLTSRELAHTIHPHPTLSESISDAARLLLD